MNELRINNDIFENIKHIDEEGNEYWYARELYKILKYDKWKNFKSVIDKAKISCNGSNYNIQNHFADVGKMVSFLPQFPDVLIKIQMEITPPF